MSAALNSLLQELRAARKTNHLWTRGEPFRQPIHAWQAGKWRPLEANAETPDSGAADNFSILSWNIDHLMAFGNERMIRALQFLEEYVTQTPQKPVMMFNEMVPSDLEIIQSQPWIQQAYHLTDISHQFWESSRYGTCILVPSFMSVEKVFRVHYEKTNQERDALYVDIKTANTQCLRICSTHLESLALEPPLRPSQMATAAKWMRKADASILGGDLNAIQPFDRTLHSDNGLKDAYIETGGQEDSESGMTWGQMAPIMQRLTYGLSRMDKFMFCGHLKIDHFETFGMDVVVLDEDVARNLVGRGGIEKAWVTDHLGIRADFHIVRPTTVTASSS